MGTVDSSKITAMPFGNASGSYSLTMLMPGVLRKISRSIGGTGVHQVASYCSFPWQVRVSGTAGLSKSHMSGEGTDLWFGVGIALLTLYEERINEIAFILRQLLILKEESKENS